MCIRDRVEFLRSELPKTGFAHTFLFMHDLLWWQPDSTQWWREVHPMLRDAKVDVVFSGDLGPMKFSTTTRDRVRYFQSSFETKPVVEILRSLQSSRLLSSQFDNFLEVRVNGAEVDVRVHTFGEVSSEMFTPELYYSANMAPPPRPQVPAWRLFWDVILPLSRPGLITLTIFTFMGTYNSFFWPLVMIKSEAKYTLPIGLMFFDSTRGQSTHLLMAAVTMSVVPMIVIFVLLQKYLVKGIQVGAVKG